MSDTEGVQAIIDTAKQTVPIKPRIHTIDGIPFVLESSEEELNVLTEVLEAADRRQPSPVRRKGTSLHNEQQSFIEHVKRYAEPSTVIWSQADSAQMTAVFNYNPAGSDPKVCGWGDHRAGYRARLSPEWLDWIKNSGGAMSSEGFADFIEERVEYITDGEGCPTPIELLEVARNLQIHTKGTFIKKVDPSTGGYHMVAKEEQDAATSTKIPRRFALALRVFEGGELYRIEALISFRISNGTPSFSYKLLRQGETEREAFRDVRAAVEEATGLPMFAGEPEHR